MALAAGIEPTDDMAEAVGGARLVLAVVPSAAARLVIRELGAVVLADQIVVHATKGLELETGWTLSRIVREETAIRKLGVLSGPNIAPEILAGLPAATVVASDYPEVVEVTQRALTRPRFRVYANDDVVGVELGGALKNIIAIASGIVTGLGLGENARSLLMTRGLAEMARFAVHRGARLLTLAGLSGMGDLVVTCASPHSRNYWVGLGLARGQALSDILRSSAWWPRVSVRHGSCMRSRRGKACTCRSPRRWPACSRASSTSFGRSPNLWSTRLARRSIPTRLPCAKPP